MSEYIYGTIDTTAEKVGYTPHYLDLLAQHYSQLVDSGRIMGAGFLLARKGQIFAHQTTGKLNYQPDSPLLQPDSIKGLASITKVFTATAIMQLVETGKLWLEQPVATVIPEFDTPLHKNIQLRHLLTHTSGLLADPGYFTEPKASNIFATIQEQGVLSAILSGPLQSEPGTQWSYSSISFRVLAEIVSRVSGKHFNDYLVTELFTPLGMTRTFMEVPDALLDRVCVIGDWILPRIAEAHTRDAKMLPEGGGGAYATMLDLFYFGSAYLNGGHYKGQRILGRKTCETMTRNQTPTVTAFHWGKKLKQFDYGLGWSLFCDGSTVTPGTYNHEGWGWSSLFLDPAEHFIYISIVNDPHEWDPVVMVQPRVIAFAGVE
jgi:CubicO group peptidase (beta-lactamase class C family)